MATFRIIKVREPEDLDAIRSLFSAYTAWLNIDLTFQGFADELANLPGKYKEPTGEILLARGTWNNEPMGCVAVRPLPVQNSSALPHKTCEIKRLYVVPDARGKGVGWKLVDEILKVAKEIGYAEAKLDTLPHMKSAIRTYERFGFVECKKYYDTPLHGTRFMRADLTCVP
ncbi:uncharacterized protein PV09_06641 [Verruconis gallopava]|uniref:N-acetyltransferase domain-containing protein n=1 Tax=Verruconis gallopava TaxID=253628 RepID=A0A0D1YN26_9PEZI|nr:uncharacterized protein PV09_06641 [Verruconis gallopava]KIW02157.1 hypothetical protein PV09_06641 [Verruconis gallopava]